MKTTFRLILRLLPSIIMLQTLFFKFSGAEESIFIFKEIGMEPWGRIGIGIAELIASILIIIPKTTFIGSLIGLVLMTGAIFFHLTTLGIVVLNDGGALFFMAIIVFLTCSLNLVLNKGVILTDIKKCNLGHSFLVASGNNFNIIKNCLILYGFS